MKKYISRILILTIAIIAIGPYLLAGEHGKRHRARCLTERRNIGGWTHSRPKANKRRANHKRRHPHHKLTIRTRRHR